jgi:hypothetical protein
MIKGICFLKSQQLKSKFYLLHHFISKYLFFGKKFFDKSKTLLQYSPPCNHERYKIDREHYVLLPEQNKRRGKTKPSAGTYEHFTYYT